MIRFSRRKSPVMQLRRKSEGGFTLFELIVAIAFTALLMGAVFNIVNLSFKGRRWVENAIQAKKIAPSLIEIIRKDIEGTFRLFGDEVVFFEGDSESLNFITTSRSLLKKQEQYAECTQVGYLLDTNSFDSSLKVLYRREEPYIDEEPLAGGKEIELYDRVVSMTIEYYDAENEEWESSCTVEGFTYDFEKTLSENEDDTVGESETESDDIGGNRWPSAIKFTFQILPSGVDIEEDIDMDTEPIEFEILVCIPVAITAHLEDIEEESEEFREDESPDPLDDPNNTNEPK